MTTVIVTVYSYINILTPTQSQYTDTCHDTPHRHSLQAQGMTPHPIIVYEHDIPPRHSIQIRDMIIDPVTLYSHMTSHTVTIFRHMT